MKTNQLFFSIQQGDQGPELTTTIGLSTLESHLWEAATLLRGFIDAGDYKQYIFPHLL